MANKVPPQRIYQQIEQNAGLYQPAIYELLTFYHALENQPDPLYGKFIPLTTVQSLAANETKVFAVGLIPPSSNVTGKLLDRSASVRTLSDDEGSGPGSEAGADVRNDPFLVRPNAGLVQEGSLSSPFGNRTKPKPEFHQGVDIRAEPGAEVRAAQDGVIVELAPDGARDGYGNTVLIEHADGTISLYAHLSGFGNGISIGTRVVAGTVVGFVGQTSAPRPTPGPHLHFEVLSKRLERPQVDGRPGSEIVAVGHFGKGPRKGEPGPPQRLEPTDWLNKQGRSIASSKSADALDAAQARFSGDAESNGKWVGDGSANANKASKTAALVANKDLNQTELGKTFMDAQQHMINQMLLALDQMAKTPPLRLLVNPQSFKVTSEKIISDGNWGRSGPIIEHWGENQDKIEASGKVAAFYSLDAYNATGPGLSRTARQFSTSYQNLLSLWLIYKNNGGLWFDDPIVPSGRGKNLSVVGSVYLYYDEILYIGSFDSLSLTESDTTPFTLEYSFSFTVRSWYLLDHLDDPQYMYGKPKVAAIPVNSGAPLSGGNNEQPSPEVALPPDPLGNLDSGPGDEFNAT